MAETISIVIPAFNEGRRLPATLEQILHYGANGVLHEVIVVDDGSRDGTAEKVRDVASGSTLPVRLVSYRPNGGKGYAVRRGVMRATADLILICDADLSTPIEELSRLRAAIESADIAIGSRAVDPSTVRLRQRWHRETMGKIFNRIMRALTGMRFADTQCGFKLLRRHAARAIFERAVVDGFAYDVEMLLLASRLGFRIAETPVLWFNSPDTRVRVVRDSLRMLFDVLALTRRVGRYVEPPDPDSRVRE